ncbi:MAG: hypothetical protein ACTSXK_18065 [Promethearchaeota archaeon]
MKKKYVFLLSGVIGIMLIGAGIFYYYNNIYIWGVNSPDPYTDEDIANAIPVKLNERTNRTLFSYSNVSMYMYHHNNSADRLVIWLTPHNVSMDMIGLSYCNSDILKGSSKGTFDNITAHDVIGMNPNAEGWLYFYVFWRDAAEPIRNSSFYAGYEIFVHN